MADDDETIFKPYVPDETSLPEMTLTVLILGALQALFFGMADAYLALKVGMTVGASIPAAVISMAVLRRILRRGSVLENNLVQNMASVGESLACGAAFTIPALYLLEDSLKTPLGLDVTKIYFVACMGGMMGILFMIPLRRYLIVKEHGRLRYPEGTACAEVLIAGDQGGESAVNVFRGIFVAGLFRILMNALGAWKEIVVWPIQVIKTNLSLQFLPSLMAVGYILGLETCGIMLAGATLGWFVIIPCIAYFGQYSAIPLPPAEVAMAALTPDDMWSQYLRYIGAGGVAFGGFVSLCKAMPTIVDSFWHAAAEIFRRKDQAVAVARTSLDMPLSWVFGGWVILFVLIGLNRGVNISGFLGSLLAVTLGFFFVTVSSRIVGLVGTTSMPLSGMTIGALLVTCMTIKANGYTGITGMMAAMVISAMVCIAISMGGDISQDLKIGFLVGATPKWVQITQIISVLFSSAVVCWIIRLLAPKVVDHTFVAPQANLIFLMTKGVIEGNLPWIPVIIGMFVAATVEFMGIGALPFAIGLYLPFELSATIVFGGLIHWGLNQVFTHPVLRKGIYEHGLLLCSGLVAGDALVGIGLAVIAARQTGESRLMFADTWFGQSSEFALMMFGLLCGFLIHNLYKHGLELARNKGLTGATAETLET